MKRLVILSDGADIGGCGIGLKRAFDQHAPGWEARAICRRTNWLEYPTDILWGSDRTSRRTITELVRTADVVHLMDRETPLGWVRQTASPDAKVVVHHLGSRFRGRWKAIRAICNRYGATQVSGSIDTLPPGVSFLPVTCPVPFENLAALRSRLYRPTDRIRIAHAPTRKAVKETPKILAAIEALAARYPVDLDLIERVPNHECLERKAKADIFVDQLGLGCGVNAIEAWAMSIPVVSGLADEAALARAKSMWGSLPWMNATPDTLLPTLERLVDPVLRQDFGEAGRRYADAWHSGKAVVGMALELYAQ